MSFAPNNRSFYLMEFRDFHDRESNERNLEKMDRWFLYWKMFRNHEII